MIDKHQCTKLPLTYHQIRAMRDQHGCIKVVMPITLRELSYEKDTRDGMIQERIAGDLFGFVLEDLSYRLLGGSEQTAIIEVSCNVDNFLETERLIGDVEHT